MTSSLTRNGACIYRGAIALALTIGSLAAVFAQPALALKRPNLDVVRAEASASPRYVFPGVNARFTFEDVTKNKGRATAGRSVTEYVLVAEFSDRHREWGVGSRRVAKLHPGDTDRGGASKTIDTSRLPLGAYDLQACADADDDVKESSENNCQGTGKEFYVVKDDWTGAVSGVGGVGTSANAETWRSSGPAHLGFDTYLGDGVFRYAVSGIVQWTDNGINVIGCHLNGSGTKPVNENNSGPGIKLKYGNATYLGTEALDKRFYTIYQSGINMFGEPCLQPFDGPSNLDFLQIPQGRRLVFDQRELKGRYHLGGGEDQATWRWDFQ